MSTVPSPGQSPADGPSSARQPTETRPVNSPPSVPAQLLATEHWSLLATRSMTQSEILSRISMFLTLVSATIVSLALIRQVTQFDQRFLTFALVLIGAVFVVGALTQMRVGSASMEDLSHVIGMNRLRAAYVNLDPTIEHYLVTSAHDDDAGWWQTYNHLVGPNTRVQLLASSGAFIKVLNAGLAGIFGALVASSRDGAVPVVTATAVVCAGVFLGASVLLGMRQFTRMRKRYVPQFASVQQ